MCDASHRLPGLRRVLTILYEIWTFCSVTPQNCAISSMYHYKLEKQSRLSPSQCTLRNVMHDIDILAPSNPIHPQAQNHLEVMLRRFKLFNTNRLQ